VEQQVVLEVQEGLQAEQVQVGTEVLAVTQAQVQPRW